ncbi:hypothetical protein CCS38_27880 [Streptomyces purpurogeneiscleroticus]|nr:hypothetical protein [Streptomyces purpurogeneiscleroticus]
MQSHKRSLARCEASRTRPDRPRVFDLAGLSWDLLDDVFAPIHSPSTGVALDFLGLSPSARPRTAGSRGSMLEIGCGTGVVSVVAALDGYERVVGTDINLHAVRNTELNVARHGVGDRMRVAHSDLFDSLPPGERFDVIFWSSNYVLAPEDYAYRNVCEQAFVDPGYAAHQRFLEQAVRWTTPGGRVLLHFTNRGDTGLLRRLAAECGRDLRLRESRTVREGEDAVEHLLLEVTPSAK